MIKKVKTARHHLSPEAVIFDEIGDILQKNIEISYNFKSRFRRTAIQQRLKDIIRYSELPPKRVLHILLYGSIGSGKTTAALSEVFDVLLDFPGANMMGVRRTYPEIEDALWKDTLEFANKFGIEHTTNKARYVVRLANGSMMRFRSAEKTAQGKSDKANTLGGTQFSVVVLDEADEIPQEYAKTVGGRMREQKGVKRKLILYICNPPSKDHWIYKMFYDNPKWDCDDPKSPYRALWMPTEENIEHVGQEYLDDIEENYSDNPALYERMRKGKFGPAVKGLPIFASTFEEDRHVSPVHIRETWNRNYPLYRCWDFGWRRPSCVVFQDDRDRGQLRILSEDLGYKQILERYAETMLDLHNEDDYYPDAQFIDICDIAGNQMSDKSELTSIDILRAAGLRPKTRRTTIAYGLSIISQQLRKSIPGRLKAQPAIIIDPRCEHIIDGFKMGYCADEKFAESGENSRQEIKPNKDGFYEHLFDALRYGFVFARKLNKEPDRNFARDREWAEADIEDGRLVRRSHDFGRQNRSHRKPPSWGGNYSFGVGH